MKRKIISILLMLPLTFLGLIGCAGSDNVKVSDNNNIDVQLTSNNKTVDLMEGILHQNTNVSTELSIETQKAITNFAIEMFKGSLSDDNMMISPISIVNALAMTSNGAVGETLTQMESVFGTSVSELSAYLKNYNADIENAEKNSVNLANSIWFKDSERFEIKQEFLQTNKDYFDADIYKSQFDKQTLVDINNWVCENTDGMIENILDEVPENAIMYLINALSFDAEWDEIYKEMNINEGEFFNKNSSISQVEFMTSEEQKVFELDNGIGFIKPYKNNEFSFVGILPNENSSVEELVVELKNIDVNEMLSSAKIETTDVVLPKFSMDYSTELTDLLVNMGMELAFDSNNAEFSELAVGDGNIYIGQVLHKTYINVDEKGTQAGASTAVEMLMKMAMPIPKNEIRLNRPFIYMIIDNNNNIPLFFGNINDIN